MSKIIIKNRINQTIVSMLVCVGLITIVLACKDDNGLSDTTPPAVVTDISFKPNSGGGTFYFKVPKDEDILFVKAVYTLDNNESIYRASSFYSDSLQIEGLGSVKPYDIQLISVDRSGNESNPVNQKVTPLAPSTELVLSTLKVIPSFSSVFVHWTNQQRKNIVIRVAFKVKGTTIIKKYASNDLKDRLLIDNLEGIPYDFEVSVEDDFENSSKRKKFEQITPFTDQLLDKSKFTFLRDELLPDSMNEKWVELDNEGNEVVLTRTLTRAEKEGGYKGENGDEHNWNAKARNLEGYIELFWDGIIDDGNLRNKNFFGTGHQGRVPFSYYIDLGQEVKMSRFRVWQRDWDWKKTTKDQTGYYYTSENVEVFELWVSNDKENWERVRRARIVKPNDPVVAREEAVAGHHFIAYEEEPKFTKPFRYLEYRGLRRFDGNNGLCNASEISIYGTTN